MRSVRRSTLGALVCAMLAAAPLATAQEAARVSVDSVAGLDLFKGTGSNDRPDASLDMTAVVRLHEGWLVYVRPWLFKSAQAATWNKEIYQAAVQYQRAGRIATRVDAGYIASPIGFGMMDMRGDANPTIRPHLSYFVPLMPFDRGSPMVGPISASYPLGGQLTMSTERWDGRAALVASAPTRRFALYAH